MWMSGYLQELVTILLKKISLLSWLYIIKTLWGLLCPSHSMMGNSSSYSWWVPSPCLAPTTLFLFIFWLLSDSSHTLQNDELWKGLRPSIQQQIFPMSWSVLVSVITLPTVRIFSEADISTIQQLPYLILPLFPFCVKTIKDLLHIIYYIFMFIF